MGSWVPFVGHLAELGVWDVTWSEVRSEQHGAPFLCIHTHGGLPVLSLPRARRDCMHHREQKMRTSDVEKSFM